jgi:MFS transporter, OFA family, oxalate/formate antiporter
LCRWSEGDLVVVFACLGVCFMAATLLGAAVLRNPPPGYMPPSTGIAQDKSTASAAHVAKLVAAPAILSLRFTMMWMIFFCNILAGISIIGFQSPIFQDVWHKLDATIPTATLAEYGATLIAVSALFNGVGRMFWGGLSDRLGRLLSFRLMLASQLAAFAVLIASGNPWLVGAMICYVLLCYGGGFGTMPSFILDVFGPQRMAVAYGVILTAWSAAGVIGPQISAFLKSRCPQDAATYSFMVGAGFLAVGLLLSLAMRAEPADKD